MTDGFIAPPPGLIPKPAAEPAQPEQSAPASEDSLDFISVPGDISDSATHRITPSRTPETPRPATTAGIVFVPASPGMPVPAPAAAPDPAGAAAPTSPPPVLAGASRDSVDADETQFVERGKRAAPSWRLVLPEGGGGLVVDTALFVGRDPVVAPSHPAAELLTVNDTTKSVSKTHALLEVADGALWVTDLNSTNGVFVVLPNDDVIDVTPGARVQVAPGSTIELGEYLIQAELS